MKRKTCSECAKRTYLYQCRDCGNVVESKTPPKQVVVVHCKLCGGSQSHHVAKKSLRSRK